MRERPRIVAVGAGIAGLVAAHECAAAGAEVTVLERDERAGGCVRGGEVAGIGMDLGAESFATRGGAVAALAARLSLADRIVAPHAAGAWLHAGGAGLPLPRGGLFGIPADLSAPEVRAVLGADVAERAASADARPVGAADHAARSLADLVRARFGDEAGDTVLARLVAPVVGGVYSASADALDVDVLAPGLRRALADTGSLTGAVRAVQAPLARAGSAVLGIAGGMAVLAERLSDAVRAHGGRILTGQRVVGVRETAAGFVVDCAVAAPLTADAVVIAVPGNAARTLLAGTVPAARAALEGWPAASGLTIAVLVVDEPALDAAPRGTGVLAAGDDVAAKALTHSTAKWPWLAEAAGPHRHVLRLSYVDERAPQADAALRARALADASVLLGAGLSGRMLRGFARTRFQAQPPAAVFGQRERIAGLAAVLPARLAVAGTWVAGTGLASVIPHAQQAAQAILGTFSNS